MRSSNGLRFGVLVFVSCCSVKIEAIQSSPSRLHSFNKRIECIGRRYNALRAQVSCSSEQVAATRAFEPPIDSIIRLRGGMALNDYFTSAKSAKSSKEQDAELKPEESKTAIDNVPIKWVVAGTVGGLCLLSNQIAHALVLGYGVTFPAYCSLKILEEFAKDSKQIANPAAANELLTYWVCFGVLTVGEAVLRPILKDVQYWEAAKVALLFWLQNGGSGRVHQKWLRPFLNQYQGAIEGTALAAADFVQSKVVEVHLAVAGWIRAHILRPLAGARG